MSAMKRNPRQGGCSVYFDGTAEVAPLRHPKPRPTGRGASHTTIWGKRVAEGRGSNTRTNLMFVQIVKIPVGRTQPGRERL